VDDLDEFSARALLREIARRSGSDLASVLPKSAPARIPRLLDPKHPHQFKAFTDIAPKLAIDAGGRSGKTTGSIRWLLEGALMAPRSMNPFIGLTRADGKLLAWDEVKAVNEQFGLGFTYNEADLIARAPNGAKVWVTGADQGKHIRKFRGHKFRRVVIEECGAQGSHLKELVEDVIEPRTADLRGQIAMLGTPNAARAGFFFEACKGIVKGWSHHHWTMFENPYMPGAREWAQTNLFEERGWTEDHPTYQREYLGNWVRDDAALVYPFSETINTYAALPEVDKWSHVLGIDIGWRDSTAFVVWGWHRDGGELYEMFSYKRPKMTLSAMFKIIGKLRETYNLRAIVADPAGQGRMLIEEVNERWRKDLKGLEIEAAEKTSKRAHIELFGDDLRTGTIKVRKDSPILDEWHLLQWDETGEDEDARFENHLSDAALYGWRRALHFRHRPKEIENEKGTPAWERQHARSLAKKIEKKFQKKRVSPLERDPLSRG
jgi:hypothetical protein